MDSKLNIQILIGRAITLGIGALLITLMIAGIIITFPWGLIVAIIAALTGTAYPILFLSIEEIEENADDDDICKERSKQWTAKTKT